MHLSCFLNAIEVGGEEGFEVRVCLSSFLDEGELVADTEAILEEKRAANALKSALAHDTNAVTEDISLIHIVSG